MGRKPSQYLEDLDAAGDVELMKLKLTPELERLTKSFRSFPEGKLRYQQLLHLATTLAPMEASLKVPENKVAGCLSTVYVDAKMDPETKLVYFKGDSDAQLTKGLVALLVNGLSGSTKEQICSVNPEFIRYSGLSFSLTPGRNNGFLNMLGTMKSKTAALADTNEVQEDVSADDEDIPGKPVCSSIRRKLLKLKPSELVVEDFSHKHAGHASKPSGTETHIHVKIVADIFEGISLVKRHQLIYTMLADELQNGVHALTIDAKTSTE